MKHDVSTPGFVEVRLDAVVRNYEKLRAGTAGTEIGAVVKANAYGLGATEVARSLHRHGCRRFFVATLEEGIALREQLAASGGTDVYVFEGLRAGAGQPLLDHALSPVLNTAAQVKEWLTIGGSCAVQIDTGMNRLGLSVGELPELFTDSSVSERLGMKYLMTHLACADEPDHPQNLQQLEVFTQAREIVGDVRVSIGNSAGAFLDERFHGDLIRSGIALYGGNPFSEHENPMDSVATLYARVLQLREVSEDTRVGYGATIEVPAGTRIAVVGVGYADGYPRILGSAALAAFNGTFVPVVGRVSMDLTCLDVTDLGADTIAIGDYVEMFGNYVSLDEIAALSSTISYEILTGLHPRLPRIYVE